MASEDRHARIRERLKRARSDREILMTVRRLDLIDLVSDRDALAARVAALLVALRRYGNHDAKCQRHGCLRETCDSCVCSCGYDAALAAPAPGATTHEGDL